MTDTVYVLYGYDAYYPPPCGVIEAFTDEKRANATLEAIEEYHHWENFDGRGGRKDDSMLPERFRVNLPKYEAYGVKAVPLRE